jgi:serine/threonine protein kinase
MVTKDERTVKIIDFGSCKDLQGTEFEKKFDEERAKDKRKKAVYKNFVGTPNYMAPECVRNRGSDKASDIWSLGCLLYQLFTGFPPFLGKSEYLIFLKSTEAKFEFPEDIVDPDAKDLIAKMIVVDPEKRPTMEEVYNHPFLKDMKDNAYFPCPKLSEIAYSAIVNSFKSLFLKYRDISKKLKKIAETEAMNEEYLKNYGESKDADANIVKINPDEKNGLQNDYNTGLHELCDKLAEIKEKLSELLSEINSKIFINKINFLEKQLKHDLFGIEFE